MGRIRHNLSEGKTIRNRKQFKKQWTGGIKVIDTKRMKLVNKVGLTWIHKADNRLSRITDGEPGGR